MTLNELDPNESLTCDYCGKVIRRAGFRGPLESQLEYHQKTRECLEARVRQLEMKLVQL